MMLSLELLKAIHEARVVLHHLHGELFDVLTGRLLACEMSGGDFVTIGLQNHFDQVRIDVCAAVYRTASVLIPIGRSLTRSLCGAGRLTGCGII